MSNNLAKSAFWLMVVTMLSKILGFTRDIVLMYFYGTGAQSDIYVTAMNIPVVVFAAVGVALSTTFIPLYQEALENGGQKRAQIFANNILCIVSIISILLSIFGYIFAEPIVKLFAISFTGEKLAMTVEFVRIIIVGVLFIGLSNIMTAYLQIQGNFTIPGMVQLPNNIIIIISMVIGGITGKFYILAVGALIGMASQFLFQVPFAIKRGYKFKPVVNFKDKYFKKMIWLILPVLIGVAVNQVNAMVDRSLASSLGDGVIAALNSANKLNFFVLGLFITSIGSVIYPTLAKLSTNNDKRKFADAVSTSVNCVSLIILPITVGAIVLATPIVRILFERGAFDDRSTQMTAIALICYSVGMIAYGLRDILSKVYYSLKDTKTPMINGIIAVGANIFFDVTLMKVFGIGGLALATSLSSIIGILLLFRGLKKKMEYYGQDRIIRTFIKSLIASIVMGVITYFMYNLSSNILGVGFIQDVIATGISVLVGAVVYGILISKFRVREVKMLKNMVMKKLKRA